MVKRSDRSKINRHMRNLLEMEVATYLLEKKKKEKIEKGITPIVGPRLKFFHYIYDEKMLMKPAIEKIISEFPAISVDDIIKWYDEEERRREKERSNSDEGR